MTHNTGFLDDLGLAPGQINRGDSDRSEHAGDWGTREADEVQPDAVVYPTSTEEVARIMAAANERGVPVTPYGAGTGLEGNATPVDGGISLDTTRMDDVLDVRPTDFQLDVQAGVMGPAITEAAAAHGLFFPPLPSSGNLSTIGGMIATDASGMQTVKYGEVADWLLRVEAVLPDGSVVTGGGMAPKTSSGYNLLGLLVGNEGTLGIVTEATLELAGRPAQIRGGRAVFPSIGAAADAVRDAVESGVDVAKIELVDADAAAMANDYSGTDLPDAPMVFLEFHANHGIESEIEFCRGIFEDHGVERFEMAGEEGMEALWRARKDLAFAIEAYDPDLEPLHPGDVTVPISAYPDVIQYAKSRGAEHGLLVPCFGHAGDGNVHYSVLVDPEDPNGVESGEAVYRDIVRKAIDLGGTVTGEHGIGTGKREYLEPEHGKATVDLMRDLKRLFDPNGVLNPGKIFPETAHGERLGGGAT